MESADRNVILFDESSRVHRAAILGASALAVWVLLFLVLPNDLPFFNDQNAYLGGAAALRAGHGYRFEQYVDLPRIGMYPPGYSVWLALFWKDGQTFAVNSYRLEVANWIAAGCAFFALAACLLTSELPALVSSAVLMLIGTSVLFTQLMTWLMADVLFVAGSCVLALLVAAYNPDRKLSVWWCAAGLLTGVLYLVKTAAMAYIVGLAAFGLLKGDLRRFSRLVCFALPTCSVMAVWFLLTRNIPTYATYFSVRISELGGLTGYFLNVIKQASLYCSGRWLVEAMLNVPDRLSGARGFLGISFLSETLAFILGLAFAIPIFFGIRRGLKNQSEQITLFLLGAVALQFFFWPFYLGARSGIALIPFISNWLWRGLPSKVAQAAFVAVLVVNIPGNAWLSYKTIRSQEKESPQSLMALQQAASWINETAGTGASVAAGRDVPLIHLSEYLGRRVLANARPISEGKYVDVNPSAQDNQWADYLITDPSFDPTGWAQTEKGYRIQRLFGRWTIASPRR
jgi:hypothetical protein